MSKSMVEKYEQILSADPESMVFVELAKALLDRGDAARAISVCQEGLQHHPESVVGRVLWGKALIGVGKPAEAMQQFDEAISVDRENPYAYNLIGEVLLHKGLHRSALPILKRAVALQPNDLRVRQWLDQTTRALNGEKAPAQTQYTAIDAAPVGEPTVPSRPSLPAMGEATVTDTQAYVPTLGAGLAPVEQTQGGEPEVMRGMTDMFQSLAAREEAQAPEPAPAPQIAAPVLEGLAVDEAREESEPAHTDPQPPHDSSPEPGAPEPEGRMAEPTRTPDDVAAAMAAPPAPVNVLARDPARTVPPPDLGLAPGERLEMHRSVDDETPLPAELVPAMISGAKPRADQTHPGPPPPVANGAHRDPDATVDLPPAAAPIAPPPLNLHSRPKLPVAPPGPPPPIPRAGKSLLPDLPQLSSPATPSMELPKVELSSQAAEAIAKEYERELREKLAAASSAPKGFWALHGLKVGAGVVAVLFAVVGVVVFRYAKRAHANLPELMTQAHTAVEKDTESSYHAALSALSDLLDVQPDNVEAHALATYAHAVLYREHGQHAADRDAALSGLGRPDVDKRFPELASAARYELSDRDSEQRDAAAKSLAQGKTAVALEITGTRLLATHPRRALEAFQQSLKVEPRHVRTYVALANYYLANGEAGAAESLLDRARSASDHHPAVLLGLVKARLLQHKDLDAAQADLAEVQKEADTLDPALRGRLDRLTGQLLAAQGKGAEALKRLSEGLLRAPKQAFAFHRAMAEVQARLGAYDKSLDELQEAARARPSADKDVALIDAQARADIAMGLPAEALELTAHLDDRSIHLTRGIARFVEGSYDAAKRELLLTRRDKTMPTEAAIYLARAELASGHPERAKPTIDTIVAAGKVSPEAQVAQGELLAAQGDLAGAQKSFSKAAADPLEYEAPYLLARILLGQGKLAEARAPLEQAVERNPFFAPAQRALGRLLLAEALPKAAREHLGKYVKAHASDALALAALARADLALGDLSDARSYARQAVSHTGRDPEVLWTHTQVELAAGNGPQTIRALEKRARALRSADALCDVGDAQLDTGDLASALATFGKAVKQERNLDRAKVGAAVATARLHGHAARGALEALAKSKLAPPLMAQVIAEQSRLAPQAEREKLARAAVAQSDASAAAHLALGEALASGPEAMHELARAVALEPAWARAHLALAVAQKAAGDPAQALTEAKLVQRIVGRGPLADQAQAITGHAAPKPRRHTKHGAHRHRRRRKVH